MTSGNLFTATPSDIASASKAVDDTVESIKAKLGVLNTLVQESAEYWQGPASTQFQNLMITYQGDSATLNNSLSAIGQGLQTTASNIGDAENINTNNITKVQLPSSNLS